MVAVDVLGISSVSVEPSRVPLCVVPRIPPRVRLTWLPFVVMLAGVSWLLSWQAGELLPVLTLVSIIKSPM